MTSTRYFVIDPGFEDFDSHHGIVAEALIRQGSSIDRIVTVIASQKLKQSLDGLEGRVKPIFETPCYTNNLKPLSPDKENELAEIFQRELSNLFQSYAINRTDVVIFHTGFSHLFLGLGIFLNGLAKQHTPKFIICGMFDPGTFSIKSPDEAARFSWFIKNKLSLSFLARILTPEKLVFATSCSEYKLGYEAAIGAPVRIHPAINYQASTLLEGVQSQGKRLLLFVGSVKKDKGLEVILDNLERFCEAFPSVNFVFHWNTNSPGIRDFINTEYKLRILSNRFDNFEVLLGTLSHEKYERLFDSVQGVMASYIPSSYKHKTSGIFWDVLRRDSCHLLSSRGTWLERESKVMKERAYFFDYGDIESMIRAISEWELAEHTVERASKPYKAIICKSFSKWAFSQF